MPAEAMEIAREIVLDNWLTWQLRHDGGRCRGGRRAWRPPTSAASRPATSRCPRTRIKDDIRKVDSVARSRLLNMRYQKPRRFRQLSRRGPARNSARPMPC